MAITFYRAFFQVARVASEPAVKLLKRIHMLNPPIGRYGNFLITFGKYWYTFEKLVSYNKLKVAEISREAALIKGIDNFYNILFFCLFFMFPVFEIIGIWMESGREKRENKAKLQRIEKELKGLEDTAKRVGAGLNFHLAELLN